MMSVAHYAQTFYLEIVHQNVLEEGAGQFECEVDLVETALDDHVGQVVVAVPGQPFSPRPHLLL
jgi:hypothetical protein